MNRFDPTERARIRREPERGRDDRALFDDIVDTSIVAMVGFTRPTGPIVLPFAVARDGDVLLLHGSTGGGLFLDAAGGLELCVNFTHVDGLIFASNPKNASINYRSAVAFGRAFPVDRSERGEALRLITEHLQPGRWDELRAPDAKELAATSVLRMPIDLWSVKMRDGGPSESASDGEDHSMWCGVLPLAPAAAAPVASPMTPEGTPISPAVQLAASRFAAGELPG